MIRVTYAEREPEDFPANQSQVGAAGELILNNVELGESIDPKTFRPVTMVQAVQWIATLSRDTFWLRAEPISEGEPDAEPAEMVQVGA